MLQNNGPFLKSIFCIYIYFYVVQKEAQPDHTNLRHIQIQELVCGHSMTELMLLVSSGATTAGEATPGSSWLRGRQTRKYLSKSTVLLRQLGTCSLVIEPEVGGCAYKYNPTSRTKPAGYQHLLTLPPMPAHPPSPNQLRGALQPNRVSSPFRSPLGAPVWGGDPYGCGAIRIT